MDMNSNAINIQMTHDDLTKILAVMESVLMREEEEIEKTELRRIYYGLLDIWGRNAYKTSDAEER